ncbi:MAG: tRNA (guanine-N7-)-methyltransferase [Saprospiraceae bacterium]|jgi:tRNA (guanine-N7-)-methyltransferase
MGKDKLKRFADVAKYKNVLEPTWEESMNQEYYLKGKWASDFFKNDNPIVLELACGGGEYTVGLARIHPDKNFLGIDIKGNRIWKGATIALNEGLDNVGFLRTRIDFIENFFSENEISEIWITFPDPQKQSNRARKRLTHMMFLDRYRKFLQKEGSLRLKTDSTFLYEFTQLVINENNFDVLVDSSDVYGELLPTQEDSLLYKELNIKTFYEKKWLEEEKLIKYLAFNIA